MDLFQSVLSTVFWSLTHRYYALEDSMVRLCLSCSLTYKFAIRIVFGLQIVLSTIFMIEDLARIWGLNFWEIFSVMTLRCWEGNILKLIHRWVPRLEILKQISTKFSSKPWLTAFESDHCKCSTESCCKLESMKVLIEWHKLVRPDCFLMTMIALILNVSSKGFPKPLHLFHPCHQYFPKLQLSSSAVP